MKYISMIIVINLCFVQLKAQTFSEIKKLLPSERASDNEFGYSVDICENYAIVGAWEKNESAAVGSTYSKNGVAYIYARQSNGNWIEVQQLKGSDQKPGDHFGQSVAISDKYAIVGAHAQTYTYNTGEQVEWSGAVYIYEKDENGIWKEIQKLHSPEKNEEDFFGYSLDISEETLLVGGWGSKEDAGGNNYKKRAGAAYIYTPASNGYWQNTQKLVSNDRESGDYFGWSVAISGPYALVGAYREEQDSKGENTLARSGSAYLYERNDDGDYLQKQKLVSSDREAWDRFGYSVALHGETAIIGAYLEDDDAKGRNEKDWAGSAYVFQRHPFGGWTEVQKLVASDRASGDGFGVSVSICEEYILIGAYGEEEDMQDANTMYRAGSAYLFEKAEGYQWKESQKIVSSDRGSSDHFGFAVAVAEGRAVIGAHRDDEDANGENFLYNAGSAYIFSEPCAAKAISMEVKACDNYTSPSGKYTWTTSGTYQDTLVNIWGCDSIITVELNVVRISKEIEIDGMHLIANTDGAKYQWLDCEQDNKHIAGANEQDFFAERPGNYAVLIQKEGCTVVTDCYPAITLSVGAQQISDAIKLYPNPSQGRVHIDLGEHFPDIEVQILTLTGQLVFHQAYRHVSEIDTELKGDVGMYIVRLKTPEGKQNTMKLIKI